MFRNEISVFSNINKILIFNYKERLKLNDAKFRSIFIHRYLVSIVTIVNINEDLLRLYRTCILRKYTYIYI